MRRSLFSLLALLVLFLLFPLEPALRALALFAGVVLFAHGAPLDSIIYATGQHASAGAVFVNYNPRGAVRFFPSAQYFN